MVEVRGALVVEGNFVLDILRVGHCVELRADNMVEGDRVFGLFEA